MGSMELKLLIVIVGSLLLNMIVDYLNGLPYSTELGGEYREFKTYKELEEFRSEYERRQKARALIDEMLLELEG